MGLKEIMLLLLVQKRYICFLIFYLQMKEWGESWICSIMVALSVSEVKCICISVSVQLFLFIPHHVYQKKAQALLAEFY